MPGFRSSAPSSPAFSSRIADTAVIVSGRFQVIVNRRVIAVRGAGDVVGELALISRCKRTATVRAVDAGVVREIAWSEMEEQLQKVDPLVGQLIRKLSDKLVEATGH